VFISAIACGIAHSVFLSSDATLFSCGMNTYGQLGLGLISQSAAIASPIRVPLSLGNDIDIAHISCGGAHTLLVDSNGALFATGSNSCGQLALNHLQDSFEFSRVEFFRDIECAFVACGEEYSAVITRSHLVYTWGLGNPLPPSFYFSIYQG
jgi:hypothetical protein